MGFDRHRRDVEVVIGDGADSLRIGHGEATKRRDVDVEGFGGFDFVVALDGGVDELGVLTREEGERVGHSQKIAAELGGA